MLLRELCWVLSWKGRNVLTGCSQVCSLLGSTTQGNGKAAELLLPQKGTCGNEECTSKNWGCIFYLLWQLSLKVFNTEIRSLYLNSCHLEKVGKNTHCAHGLSINKRNNRILDVENQEIKVIPDTCATKYTVQTNPQLRSGKRSMSEVVKMTQEICLFWPFKYFKLLPCQCINYST